MGTDPPAKTILAPAKLNIFLKVIGRRSDGYHELVSIMVPVALFDRIQLTVIHPQRITLACQGFSVPDDEDNLVYRAARSFLSMAKINRGLSIKLSKNIPVAAGLGGGSSDAAWTLRALNEMWARPLSSQDLIELAVQLGADVPFFMYNSPCIARGIGEILEPLGKWPKFWYVIVKPPIGVSTAWVYANLKLELTEGEDYSMLPTFGKGPLKLIGMLKNDLETVTASRFPVISAIKQYLIDAGAEGALMSGSGPSVFGVFNSESTALSAKEYLISLNMGDVFAVKGVV
ncbi:MAG: 4-(cytidine 5'-diphospho)-2-C-methyl-D-erythritol kinase [Desulfobacterales bacterium]|nr:4-(cytidine 5'-diphospho)-2-C-methyl-D-erythritol kinase [Desulfobacterales bacterium]